MKIYSWNVYYHSKTPEKQFEYIKNLDLDILCLQEVPEGLLERFKTLPYHIASGIDIAYFSKKKEGNIYTVILSRYPIHASGEIVFPSVTLPSRAKLLLRIRPDGPALIASGRSMRTSCRNAASSAYSPST